DLLLEAEIGRFADPDGSGSPGPRRFRLSPQSLRRPVEQGYALADIDTWFVERTGFPLSAAGRVLLLAPQMAPPSGVRLLVVQCPTAELTDGVMQWPATAALVRQRLGPTAVVIDEDEFDAFRRVLAEIGVSIS